MHTLKDVKAGDAVIMVYVGWASSEAPFRATVTEAKRINLTITEEGSSGRPRVWKIRRDSRREHADQRSGHYGWHAYTPDEWNEKETRKKASETLKRHGIYLEIGSLWRGREIELATLLESALNGEDKS